MIVSGSASQSLAAALAAETGRPLSSTAYERFPDGELLAAAPGFDGDRAVVVASTVSSDAHLELLQLQDAVREWGATEVVTVIPYLGYARQDKPLAPGDAGGGNGDGDGDGDGDGNGDLGARGYPISARAVARAVSAGTDRILVVNPHAEAVCAYFDPPAEPVDAAGRLAEPLPPLDDPLFLAPDANAESLAETVRDAHGAGETDYFEKTRLSGTDVEIAPSDAEVAGRDVVVVDDIIATGGTMSESIAVLGTRDAARVFATCVHPVLARSARTRLARAGVEAVFGTDTVESAASAVSVAPALADAL